MTYPRKLAYSTASGHKTHQHDDDEFKRASGVGASVGIHTSPAPSHSNVHVNTPPSNSVDHGEDLTWMDTVFGGIGHGNSRHSLTSRFSFASRNSFTSRHSFTSRGSLTGDQHNLENCGIVKLLDVEASHGNGEEHEGDKKPKAQPPPPPLKGDLTDSDPGKSKTGKLRRDESNGTGSSKNSSAENLSCSGLSSLEISGDSSDVEAALNRAESAAADVDSIRLNSSSADREFNSRKRNELVGEPSSLDYSHHFKNERLYDESMTCDSIQYRVGERLNRRFRSLEGFSKRERNARRKPSLDEQEYSGNANCHKYDHGRDQSSNSSFRPLGDEHQETELRNGRRGNDHYSSYRNSAVYDEGVAQGRGHLLDNSSGIRNDRDRSGARAIVEPSPPVNRPTVLGSQSSVENRAPVSISAPFVPSLGRPGGLHVTSESIVDPVYSRYSNAGTTVQSMIVPSASNVFTRYGMTEQHLPHMSQQISPNAPPFPAIGPSGYIDYSTMSDNAVAAHFGMMMEEHFPSGGSTHSPFPQRLHEMLTENKFPDIVSWSPHGRAFVVRRTKEFETKVLPLYFKQTKYRSFQRQLNLYGFRRITHNEADRGGYYHELFLRGRRKLSTRIRRQGTNQYRRFQQQQQQMQEQQRAASVAAAFKGQSPNIYNIPSGFMSFMGEPNFYSMEPLTEHNSSRHSAASSSTNSVSTIVVPPPETIASQQISLAQGQTNGAPSPLPLGDQRTSQDFWMVHKQRCSMPPPRRPKYRDRRNVDNIVPSSSAQCCDCGCNCVGEGLSHAHVVDPAT